MAHCFFDNHSWLNPSSKDGKKIKKLCSALEKIAKAHKTKDSEMTVCPFNLDDFLNGKLCIFNGHSALVKYATANFQNRFNYHSPIYPSQPQLVPPAI